MSDNILSNADAVNIIFELKFNFGRGVELEALSIYLILYSFLYPFCIFRVNILSLFIDNSIESLFSDLLINFENSSILTPNLTNESHSYFSNEA